MTTTTELRKNGKRDFTETHWSLVKAAGDRTSPAAAAALDTLCQRYWPPIYVYLRQRGYSKHDAQDFTQSFFEQIINNNAFARAKQSKGKFRSYLMSGVNHFLSDDWDRRNAQKRVSDHILLPLDAAEAKYLEVPAPDLTPEKAFDYRWRLTLLEQGLQRLEEEFKANGKERQFSVIKPYLTAKLDAPAREKVARELNMSVNFAGVSVTRFRDRFRDCVRAELAETVANEEELAEELRDLFGAQKGQS